MHNIYTHVRVPICIYDCCVALCAGFTSLSRSTSRESWTVFTSFHSRYGQGGFMLPSSLICLIPGPLVAECTNAQLHRIPSPLRYHPHTRYCMLDNPMTLLITFLVLSPLYSSSPSPPPPSSPPPLLPIEYSMDTLSMLQMDCEILSTSVIHMPRATV